jgi:predicted nucleic acid-binding protein
VAVFVDTNVIVYAATAGPYREACLTFLEAVTEGRVEGRTSTAVIEEVWHLEMSGRLGRLDRLARRAYELFTPLLPVTDETVRVAIALDASALGAKDRIHVATCRLHGIGTIVTADGAFDLIEGLERIDPLDDRALSALLGLTDPGP